MTWQVVDVDEAGKTVFLASWPAISSPVVVLRRYPSVLRCLADSKCLLRQQNGSGLGMSGLWLPHRHGHLRLWTGQQDQASEHRGDERHPRKIEEAEEKEELFYLLICELRDCIGKSPGAV